MTNSKADASSRRPAEDSADSEVPAALAAVLSAGPAPEPQWESTVRLLVQASRARSPGPAWWSDDLAFFGMLETEVARSTYDWDGTKRPATPPFALFQFTLAGWGLLEDGGVPQRMDPGTGFVAVVPSRHRYYLPKDSPGWTFAWINLYNPYLIDRINRQIAQSGATFRFEPQSPFLASALRVISGCLRKDFRDKFEIELALFEFVIAYERLAHQLSDPLNEGERLLEAVRKLVLADPKRTFDVESLAAGYGMSRTHFSHFFRRLTGQTPARLVAQTRIQEATRMLRESDASLRDIADACGFANVNHFSRVFYRFQNIQPGAYRKLIA